MHYIVSNQNWLSFHDWCYSIIRICRVIANVRVFRQSHQWLWVTIDKGCKTHIYIYIEERQLSSPRRAKGFQRAGLIWETIRDQMRGASIVFAQPKWWNRGRLSNYHYTSVCLYGLLLEPRMCAFLRHFPVSRESGGGEWASRL